MPDVICFGEMLIDFVSTEAGMPLIQAPAFEKAPGGAPANVAVGLSKLGESVGFMGQVGDDDFGRFLAQTLASYGVNVGAMRFSREARTALAFVSVMMDGERDFMFYRHPSADMLFEASQVETRALRDIELFHFGSITLIDDPVRSATLHAVRTAQTNGALISYDPNLRLNLWPSADAAREGIMLGLPFANVVKLSREELTFLTDQDDIQMAAVGLWHDTLKVMLITDGAEGSYYFAPGAFGQVPTFDVDTVDTTGAGDGFMAGFLHYTRKNPEAIEDEDGLRQAVRFANAVGALTTTQRGAIPALPSTEQVQALLNE